MELAIFLLFYIFIILYILLLIQSPATEVDGYSLGLAFFIITVMKTIDPATVKFQLITVQVFGI